MEWLVIYLFLFFVFNVHMNLCVYVCNKSGSKFVRCFSCFDKSSDVVFLVFEWLMLESKPGGLNFSFIIEDNVKRVLFSADAVLLTTIAVNLNLREHFHLVVKR